MAGKGATFENDVLKLIFNGTAIANLADNAASSPLTSLYLSLHTADPTDSGNQTSSETTYTGYARVAVTRNSGGFTVSGSTVVPAATITHVAIGTASSGTGKILYSGTVSPNIVVSSGVIPRLTTASTITEG
jgi:hypothetical protein